MCEKCDRVTEAVASPLRLRGPRILLGGNTPLSDLMWQDVCQKCFFLAIYHQLLCDKKSAN